MTEETNRGRASDWFEPLYAEADGDAGQVPWTLPGAVPYLTDWLQRNEIEGRGRSAGVVGCGLGDDAEALAKAGFAVTGFDISKSAIAWAKKRFPQSSVNYVIADLFNLPADWLGKFELVFDFRTIQALPLSVRAEVIEKIAALGAPQGTVLIATYMRGDDEDPGKSAPWPLSSEELAQFEKVGLEVVRQERFTNKDSRFRDRTLTQYRVP
ncbi:bifunctional 2-polyprenyl-6-hydroxyphenol methylase/3-demethylubiquinol 3-O-methyltransferase UbiG [cf. Phormidesmis sp. LEGE 11477]|uniref:class I SAM-dependent methyltransferase n=1 Tax=cf. Phormidesmis sp. LEGE 11477 TaxID=1828680 RepID=UPI00187F2FCC|nr:class I SAM-dependent methyltransferase [cf. Phormidesmis sp. LEGE 11477]MBE9062905.1 class I SAM-dependent methyltransferase [cf. Phormidesmis sp. LEGE 11477]